jgi:hypothetical protein
MSFLASATNFENQNDDEFFVNFDEDGDHDTRVYNVPLNDTDAESTVMKRKMSRGTLETPQEEDNKQYLARSISASSLLVASKSALKQNYKIEDIPVCTKRRSWKTLPAPDMKEIKTSNMKRVESMGSFCRPPSPETKTILKKSSSKVSFQNVTIREYDLTLGDNPSVSYGPPVSLDWNYSEMKALSLDLYEGNRPQRRSMRQMNINFYQRKHLLTMNGYTEEEIEQAKRNASKVRSQRAVTRQFLVFQKVEDVLESASRKANRIIKGGGRVATVDALTQSLPNYTSSGIIKGGDMRTTVDALDQSLPRHTGKPNHTGRGLTKRCMSAPALASLDCANESWVSTCTEEGTSEESGSIALEQQSSEAATSISHKSEVVPAPLQDSA